MNFTEWMKTDEAKSGTVSYSKKYGAGTSAAKTGSVSGHTGISGMLIGAVDKVYRDKKGGAAASQSGGMSFTEWMKTDEARERSEYYKTAEGQQELFKLDMERLTSELDALDDGINSLVTAHNERYPEGSKRVWREDSADYLNTVSVNRKYLSDLKNSVEYTLSRYGKYFDSGELARLKESLFDAGNLTEQIYSTAEEDRDFLSNFNSETDFRLYDIEHNYADYDPDELQAEIDELQNYVDRYNNIQANTKGAKRSEIPGLEKDAYDRRQRFKALIKKETGFESVNALKDYVSKLRAAKTAGAKEDSARVTEAEVMARDDFAERSLPYDGGWDLGDLLRGFDADYTYINKYQKDQIDLLTDKNPIADILRVVGYQSMENRGLRHLNKKELDVYNYLYNTDSPRAKEYLEAIENRLLARKAAADFAEYEGNTFAELLHSIESGIDRFGTGIRNIGNAIIGADGDTSSTQILSSMIREDLKDDGPQIFGSSLGQIGYDLGSTTANMAPSILVSMVNPTAGAALMGGSAGGNAYAQMMALGYDVNQSRAYGLLVGGSEATLQRLLNGAGTLGGKGVGKLTGGAINKALTKIDDVLKNVAIKHPHLVNAIKGGTKLTGSVGGEIVEEELQLFLEPLFKSWVTNETYLAPDFEEMAYTALITALSTGVIEGAPTVYGVHKANKANKANKSINRSPEYIKTPVNVRVVDMVKRVLSGNFKQNEKINLGKVNSTVASKIKELTGVNVDGFDVAIEARQIEHIIKDHGIDGRTDHSMADANDIAKIEYVLNNPDKMSKSGKTQAYSYTDKAGRNKTADTVLYEKSIGEDSYYAVQAVADTKAKTLHVVSAFIGKPGYEGMAQNKVGNPVVTPEAPAASDVQFSDAADPNVGSPVATSETDFASNVQLTDAADKSIIPQNASAVKPDGVTRAASVEAKARESGKAATVSDYASAYGDQAQAFMSTYKLGDGSVDAATFAREFELAYDWGESGVREAYALSGRGVSLTSSLTPAQREIAYRIGSDARKASLDNASDVGYNEKREVGENYEEKVAVQDAGRGASEDYGSDEGTLSQNRNESRVQKESEKSGRNIKGTFGTLERQRTLSGTQLRYPESSFVAPKPDSIEEHEIAVLQEYGIECRVVKKQMWDRGRVPAFVYNGIVYLCEDIGEHKGKIAPHEATHVMRHKEYIPYLDFISRSPSMINMDSVVARQLIAGVASKYDISLDADSYQFQRLYDEINATIYGDYIGGDIVGELRSQLEDAFYDFDAYISELQAIHEQFKRDNTGAINKKSQRTNKRNGQAAESLKTGTSDTISISQSGDFVNSKSVENLTRAASVEAKARESGKAATVSDYAAAYGDQAQAFMSTYKLGDGSVDAATFAREFELAYDWGESGVREAYALSGRGVSLTSSLTPAQREIAYRIGSDVRQASLDNSSDVGYNEKREVGENYEEKVAVQDAGRGDESIQGSNERAQPQDGNGSRVQEGKRKDTRALGEAPVSRRVQSKASERLTDFSEEDIVTPHEDSKEYTEQQVLENEYGISAYIIKKSAWPRNATTYASDGAVYIREGIKVGANRDVAGHEATHVMAQVKYAPYLDFLERTSSMIDMSSTVTRNILKIMERHCEEDLLYDGDESNLRVFDELNATMYEIGLAEGIDKSSLSDTAQIFYDFDAYISELQAIHEQFKRDNTGGKAQTQASSGKSFKKGSVSGHNVTVSEVEAAFKGDHRRNVIGFLRAFAEATGIDIVLYKSTADDDGNLVGDIIDGVDLRDAQGGFSWANNKIYIDINAGVSHALELSDVERYTMLRTFAHEFIHFCEKWNPAGYDAFRSLVFETLDSRGYDVHELIEAKRGELNISYEKASREVVADAMTDILPESDFMSELYKKSPGLAKELISRLKAFISKIKAYFKKLSPNTDIAANALKVEADGVVRYMEDIVKAFDKLAASAVERYQSVGSDADADADTGKVSKQARRLSEKDLDSYLRAGNRANKKKGYAIDNGQKIILTTEQEISDFIDDAIDQKTGHTTVAYGQVNSRLASEVSASTKGSISIDDYYLELVPSDLYHAFVQHNTAKQAGDIGLSREDFKRIPEYLDHFDELLYAIKYSSGKVSVCVSKKLSGGRMLIIETVSKSRGALQLKNAIGVSEEKYQNEYIPIYKKGVASNSGESISSNISPRDESDSINSISQPDGIVKSESSEKVSKQKRTSTLSNREVLSIAADGMDIENLTEGERAALDIYKKRLSELSELEGERAEQARLWHDNQFSSDGDKAEALAAKNRMSVLDAKIERARDALLSAEGKKAVASVIAKAKAVIGADISEYYRASESRTRDDTVLAERMHYGAELAKEKRKHEAKLSEQRARSEERIRKMREMRDTKLREQRERYAQSRRAASDKRHRTELRRKIRRVTSELERLLMHPTKEHHIPGELQAAVAEALGSVDMGRASLHERLAALDERIDNAKTDAERVRLEALRDELEGREYNMTERLISLRRMYEEAAERYPHLMSDGDRTIADAILSLSDEIGDVSLPDMEVSQLERVYDMYKTVLHVVRTANRIFSDSIKATVSEAGGKAILEVRKIGGVKADKLAALRLIEKFGVNNLKPEYLMRLIGSDTLTELFKDFRRAEGEYGRIITEARAFALDTMERHGYFDWDFDVRTEFVSDDGNKFELSLSEIMALYAYSKRPAADKHLSDGGFIFDEANVFKKNGKGIFEYYHNSKETYRLSHDSMDAVISALTSEQRAFVDEMQAYLSDGMAKKGNAVSRVLYGIDIFKDAVYFPLTSAKDYAAGKQESANAPAKLKNSGFTKETVPGANNPIVLSGFLDVWGRHVSKMSMYSSFVVPLENFGRVYGFKSAVGDGGASVRASIVDAYGSAVTDYLDVLLADLNGGARVEKSDGIGDSLLGLHKKASVMASLSVVIQQPSAIERAKAYLKGKYFHGKKSVGSHRERWEELKRYAPVAIIKEIGHFDTGMGMATADWLSYRDPHGIREGVKAFFKKDGTFRDELFGKMAGYMDEVTWLKIWDACRREVADNHGVQFDSEENRTLAGERFSEVIALTQVYDSVLSRSAHMRNRSTYMKMATSFMAEPTTSVNMLFDAALQAKRGNRRFAGRAVIAVARSVILNSMLSAVVYAMRDDDEDETYLEKYLQAFTKELVDGVNPLGMIPFGRDIISLSEGYKVERDDMTLFTNLITSVKGVDKAASGLFTGEADISDFGGELFDMTADVSQLFGIPARNIIRDIEAIINTATNSVPAMSRTTVSGLLDALSGGNTKNGDQLYNAAISGDTAHFERVAARYSTDAEAESALKAALRERDGRIADAARARIDGDSREYGRIVHEIASEGHFDEALIASAVALEAKAMRSASSDGGDSDNGEGDASGAYSIYEASDVGMVLDSGDASLAREVISELIKVKVSNGSTLSDAKGSIKSALTRYYRDAYINGTEAERARIRKALWSSGLYEDVDDIIDLVVKWLNGN